VNTVINIQQLSVLKKDTSIEHSTVRFFLTERHAKFQISQNQYKRSEFLHPLFPLRGLLNLDNMSDLFAIIYTTI